MNSFNKKQIMKPIISRPVIFHFKPQLQVRVHIHIEKY